MPMAGDIQNNLHRSEAAESLRMEMRIAKIFERHKWPAETGMYYTDINTGKPREIDVYVQQVFERPQRVKGIGGPILNLYIFCECKSLKGSNILFSQGKMPEHSRNTVMDYWVGNETELREIVLGIAEQMRIEHHAKIKALYDYAVGRAYAYEGRALRMPVSMPPPPVDLISRAFRETKGGEIKNDHTSDQGVISPLWNAIRSSLSATKAVAARARSTSLGWVSGTKLAFYGIEEFNSNIAFFLDAELLRNCFFHPIVVLNAGLWHLDENRVERINNVRLYMNNIESGPVYVDIVSESSAEQYIDAMILHFEKASRRSVSKLWKMIEELVWAPGQAEKALGDVLRQCASG